jgi:hypothetical protein
MSVTVTIQNLIDQRILLCFNSGQTQHLAPHETIADVAATEIKSNAKIEKLLERRVIAVARTEESAGAKRSQPRKSAAKQSGSN